MILQRETLKSASTHLTAQTDSRKYVFDVGLLGFKDYSFDVVYAVCSLCRFFSDVSIVRYTKKDADELDKNPSRRLPL